MSDIVLATLNARYIHSAFGLRYLFANLGGLQPRATLLEFDLQQRPLDIVERLLASSPRIIGFGAYIWNLRQTTEVVELLRQVAPDVAVILGGPEVSHEAADLPIVQLAHHVIPGEADLAFADLCRRLLAGEPPVEKILPAPLPPLDQLVLPYDLYTETDIAHRIVYVEASRGCPFHCEFCLSSLDLPVRAFPIESFLAALDRLLARGARHLKFVDRTFNLNLRLTQAILDFFLDRLTPELFLHFELIPDRLPTALRERIARFPPGTLQFEIGIQTFNPEVADRIRRRQDIGVTEANLRFLRTGTGVHLHADLIVGLPGESLESFAAGFDRLVALHPQEIQVGVLKRLRGTPISRHDADWGVVWSPLPPYEILANRLLDFPTMQRLRRFAATWERVANSGHFQQTTPLLWQETSPFEGFLAFSDWLHAQTGGTHALALPRLVELLHEYLTAVVALDPDTVRTRLIADTVRPGRAVPACLEIRARRPTGSPSRSGTPRRQRRHLADLRQATGGSAQ